MELRSKKILPTYGTREEDRVANHSPRSVDTVLLPTTDTENLNQIDTSTGQHTTSAQMTQHHNPLDLHLEEEEGHCRDYSQSPSQAEHFYRHPFEPFPLRKSPVSTMPSTVKSNDPSNINDGYRHRNRDLQNNLYGQDRYNHTYSAPYQQRDTSDQSYSSTLHESPKAPHFNHEERRQQIFRPTAFRPTQRHINYHSDINNSFPQERQPNNYDYRVPQPYYLQQAPQQPWRPQIKLPTFTGKTEEWQSFWIQFQLCAKRFHFDDEEFATQLLMSLKGSALAYATSLGFETLQDPNQLSAALKSRYNLNIPAQTHRASLTSLRKSANESLQDYASRVQTAMLKAYPDIEYTETFVQLTIQQFLSGYHDQEIAIDVQKFNPQTLAETIDKLTWLESCKQNARKRQGLRQVNFHNNDFNTDNEEDTDLRRINGKRFVTEERLMQHERDLQRSLQKMFRDFMSKCFNEREETITRRQDQHNEQFRKPVRCYSCNEEGHLSYNCNARGSKDKRNNQHNTEEEPLNLPGLSQVANTQSRM